MKTSAFNLFGGLLDYQAFYTCPLYHGSGVISIFISRIPCTNMGLKHIAHKEVTHQNNEGNLSSFARSTPLQVTNPVHPAQFWLTSLHGPTRPQMDPGAIQHLPDLQTPSSHGQKTFGGVPSDFTNDTLRIVHGN